MSLLLLAAAAAAITDVSRLSLVCTGSAAVEGGPDRSLVIDVDIWDREGRIRLPREMRPTINTGSDGWFGIDDLYINDRSIEGRVELGPFEKTGFSIDRASGMLETRDGFQAQCEPVKSGGKKF